MPRNRSSVSTHNNLGLGKFAAVLGPMVVSLVFFFVAGAVLLSRVDERAALSP